MRAKEPEKKENRNPQCDSIKDPLREREEKKNKLKRNNLLGK